MQSVKPQIPEIAGYTILPIDVTTMIANVVNVIMDGNRRPTLLRQLAPKDLRQWRMVALKVGNQLHLEELVGLLRTGAKTVSPTALFLEQYAAIAAALVAEPRYAQDAGEALKLGLKESGGWVGSFIATPSLGYAREYLRLDVPYLASNPPFDLPAWDVPDDTGRAVTETDGTSNFRDALAQLTQLMDRSAISDRLVPEQKALVSRDARDAYFGQAKSALLQMERLTAAALLWQRQADAFVLRVNQSLWDVCMSLAVALYPRERPMLEFYAKLRTAALAAIPCHPLLESIANMVGRISLTTLFGTKPCAVRQGNDPGARPSDGTGGRGPTGPTASVLASQMVMQAVAEVTRMRALTAANETWPRAWAVDVAPEMPIDRVNAMLGVGLDNVTIGQLLEWLSRSDAYVKHWPEIARTLGWTGAIGAPEIDIMAAGADFVLTDGDFYSSQPAAVLAGLRPGLSLGNILASGARIRFDENFGTGPDITSSIPATNGGEALPVAFRWSTLVIEGHVSAVDAAHTMPRFYVPVGMMMGESTAEFKFIDPGTTDHVGKAVQAFYKERSPSGFVRQWYGTPVVELSRITPDAIYMRTSWDTFTEAGNAAAAQGAMLAGYGPTNVDKQPISVFAFRPRWNLRVPVGMSRANHFEWYDEMGALRDIIPFDGAIIFDDNISLSTGVEALNPYVDLLRVVAPNVTAPANEEVKPPEDGGAVQA